MKNECLVIRYGELFLKGRNKPQFIQRLVNNIKKTAHKNNFSNFQVQKLSDQLIITTEKKEELTNFLPCLKNIFGISNFCLAYQLESNFENLLYFVENLPHYYQVNFNTFRLDIKRSDKNFPKNSLILQKELGEIIRKKYSLKVDLSNPQKTFYVRIYQQFILIFSEREKGLGGLPVGSTGQVLLLLSGGIDSPVAAHQLMKRGCEVIYLHFYYQKEGQKKIINLVEKLQIYNNYSSTIYWVDFQPFLNEIRHISQTEYRLIILKRMFIRCACLLAQELKIKVIATGDSLSQVASQTLESLAVIQQASITAFEPIKNLTQKITELLCALEKEILDKKKIESICQELEKTTEKLREEKNKQVNWLTPLIGYDKNEIIKKARQIGTYDLSLENYLDCCSLFEPPYPVTRPKNEIAEKLEKEILWQETLEKVFWDLKLIIK